MQIPADLKINDEHFLHLTVREGGAALHSALLEFYIQSFGLDRVVLRDEAGRLDRVVLADLVGGMPEGNLRAVLRIGADGVVEDIRAKRD
ncbi:MAG: hypothetical protein ACRCS3_13430 [Paracoccaceae bacterium]